jgi:hypothetical protein
VDVSVAAGVFLAFRALDLSRCVYPSNARDGGPIYVYPLARIRFPKVGVAVHRPRYARLERLRSRGRDFKVGKMGCVRDGGCFDENCTAGREMSEKKLN